MRSKKKNILGFLIFTLFMGVFQPVYAGNIGDYYLNMDGGHSVPNLSAYPEITHLPQERSFNQTIYPDKVVVGNASLAYTSGYYWSSLPRYHIFRHQLYADVIYAQYMNNDAFVYPEHRDYDDVNHYVYNTPTLWISQGSSGSDKKFVQFIFDALNTFSATTKDKLKSSNLVMPTIQMLYRRSLVDNDQDYLTWKSQPTVFNVAGSNEKDKMRPMAAAMQASEIPPMVQLEVIDVGNWTGKKGVDFYEISGSERFIETPVTISRIFRGRDYTKWMIVSAEQSYDANSKPLTYHWKVLEGDPSKVRIIPQNGSGSEVRIEIDYHEETTVSGTTKKTNRVDIGCFVHNGRYYSAPGFVTSHSLRNETRTYNSENKLVKIDYDSDYIDPYASRKKSWGSDEFVYSNGMLRGWRRIQGSTTDEFVREGYLVVQGSLDTLVATVQRVSYYFDSSSEEVRWRTTGDVFDYEPGYILTVNNGTGDGVYPSGTPVNVTANDPASRMKFDQWTGDIQYLDDPFSANTVFTIPSVDATITANFIESEKPVANITVDKLIGNSPLAVTFNGSTSFDPDGSIVSWSWNYGDGSDVVPGTSNPHVFEQPGSYTVTLVVTDNHGAQGSSEVKIQVNSPSSSNSGNDSRAINIISQNKKADFKHAPGIIFDRFGKELGRIHSPIFDGKLNGESLASGIYIIQFPDHPDAGKRVMRFSIIK